MDMQFMGSAAQERFDAHVQAAEAWRLEQVVQAGKAERRGQWWAAIARGLIRIGERLQARGAGEQEVIRPQL